MSNSSARTRFRVPSRTVAALALALSATLVAACGDSDDDTIDTGASTSVSTEAGADDTTTTAPSTSESTSSTVDDVNNGRGAGDDPLPGEALDMGPLEGTEIAVVNVAADDVLFVRALPDPDAEALTELDPLTEGLVHTGRKQLVDSGAWWELELPDGNGTGWANSRHLSVLGQVDDATSAMIAAIGETPAGDSPEAVVDMIEDHYTRLAEEPIPTIVTVQEPVVGDLIEMIIDITGYGDDSILGERFHLFIAHEGDSYVLKSAEATTLCRRGANEERLCL